MHSDLGTIYAENSMILASSSLPGPLLRLRGAFSALGPFRAWAEARGRGQAKARFFADVDASNANQH